MNGYDKNYKKAFIDFNLIPVLNSPLNLTSFFENNKSNSASIQIDIGMRRLGFQQMNYSNIKKLSKNLI